MLGVRGFCKPLPERLLGFGVSKLPPKVLGRRAGTGVQRRGVGGGNLPPLEGSKHYDQGSTDFTPESGC